MDRQYYLWKAAGSPVTVALAPEVISRLRREAAKADAGRVEIGGILLGRRDHENRILIEDFEQVPSEHRRGLTFTLSQADRTKLAYRLRASHRGLQTLGSFRTHLRQGLYMDQYDLDLMALHFAAPADVMLLLRPKDWHAGFFVWEEGDIHREKSYLEFPFDSTALPLTSISIQKPGRSKSTAANSWLTAARFTFPTLAKTALLAATAGLVAVLAYYAHEHRSPMLTQKMQPAEAVAVHQPGRRHITQTVPQVAPQTAVQSAPTTADINPPFDPDLAPTQHEDYELRVKIPLPPKSTPGPIDPPQPDRVAEPPTRHAAVPHPVPHPSEPPPIQYVYNVPPNITAITAVRPQAPRRPVMSEVSLEPTRAGAFSRGIRHIPGLNLLHAHKQDNYSPARPVREVKPRLPEELERNIADQPAVDLKVWIDNSGQVTKTEILSKHSAPEVAEIASNAARKWTFEPAQVADRPVSSEMVMHFRFLTR